MPKTYGFRKAAKYINQTGVLEQTYTSKMLKRLRDDVRLVPKIRRRRYTQEQLDTFVKEVRPR
ncbi:hypothetical protein [Limosilactobacillus mucosae]|jgi:hypothetical protein|uniref:hypothetical protein n=1 Tax=Limosilactobacillus mucosae TaxID=97478 RepID=UPI00242A96BE|nr:hypothetical protein [Limosilactobacillus mucosae]MCI1490351.1 hypothetical protein [Limosilactobacillus mucosae]MCI1525706.1 hypothetical protein [Limosilactobacillus mucosae]MDM8220310.1 hypothetical protein [Limosilactobacillus mucosae]